MTIVYYWWLLKNISLQLDFLESKTPRNENINKTNITQYSRILKKLISRHNLIELSNVKNKVRNSQKSRKSKTITWKMWVIRLFWDGSEILCTWRLSGQLIQNFEGLYDIIVKKPTKTRWPHAHSIRIGLGQDVKDIYIYMNKINKYKENIKTKKICSD